MRCSGAGGWRVGGAQALLRRRLDRRSVSQLTIE